MYTVYAVKSTSTDHICIGESRNMEIKMFFFVLTTRYRESVVNGISLAAT